tara:strand:+ start:356 stop:574 length:219 start_codon:yes stop_codon:yes gene_type:complete
MVVGSGKDNMTDKTPTTYYVVEIDRWNNHYILPNTTLDDVNKVRKIRDIKSEETKLLKTEKRYAVGSIQPFL